jgi:hypothetical protein
LVPASVRSLGVAGVAYLALAQSPASVELVLATRADETAPLVGRVAALITAHLAQRPDPRLTTRPQPATTASSTR